MKMLRLAFSFKLVLVFVLLTLLSAVPKPAIASHLVKCPCAFAAAYAASIRQAESLGLENNLDICYESTDFNGMLFLQHPPIGGDEAPCYTFMYAFPPSAVADSNTCMEVMVCYVGYDWRTEVNEISEDELKACQDDLKMIARRDHLLPCEPY